ncbi:D-lactonohydrolase-like protein-like protein [Amylocarpus encephaloides]|uniref:D-lactonohydrolase-like protein-like protein n=1 Tax=Amylocarpus encephaloides TaxID=45428 RepID=A0A9P7YP41_9HELO|nr:D-lactonohydrolase-like protein-like protein [Amylocarpus encephaloides]
MTTLKVSDLPVLPIEVKTIDRAAESNGSVRPFSALPNSDELTILSYDQEFTQILGTNPTQSLLLSTTASTKNPFFHEACVFLPSQNELYITSNLLASTSSSAFPTILISRIKFTRAESSNDIKSLEWAKLRPPPGIDMPNGGVNYKDGILFCAQGSPAPGTGGLYYMPLNAPPKPIVTNWHARDFNSVNDVVVSKKDGGIWFTDPCYGYQQGFRRRPELPNQVYRYDIENGECRVVADGFERCNGICFAPGEGKVYISDTGVVWGDGGRDLQRPATIYSFDVSPSNALTNRTLFAYAAQGIPDGIKCDTHGNVYSGTGAGVEVWNPSGSLIGTIVVPGGLGCANFCFGNEGEMFICGEQRLWRVQLGEGTSVRGDLLGV